MEKEEFKLRAAFERSEMLLGADGMERLAASHVAVFGVGGVGSHAAEALVRCGVGRLTLVDGDVIAPSNLNRQIMADASNIGVPKVDAMRERALRINPGIYVTALNMFYCDESADQIDLGAFDYIVDAIDTVASKLALILRARLAGTRVISSMGAGNKLDPARFEIADIYETGVCPLARVMRRELKKRGITELKVVYSRETPVAPPAFGERAGRSAPGSVSFVPPAAGLILAGAVVRDITGVIG
jgi:tRNA A37 threonylcarbamoyladenosine dehydratase